MECYATRAGSYQELWTRGLPAKHGAILQLLAALQAFYLNARRRRKERIWKKAQEMKEAFQEPLHGILLCWQLGDKE